MVYHCRILSQMMVLRYSRNHSNCNWSRDFRLITTSTLNQNQINCYNSSKTKPMRLIILPFRNLPFNSVFDVVRSYISGSAKKKKIVHKKVATIVVVVVILTNTYERTVIVRESNHIDYYLWRVSSNQAPFNLFLCGWDNLWFLTCFLVSCRSHINRIEWYFNSGCAMR